MHRYFKYLPFYLASLLPTRVLYILSDGGFLVLYYLIRYRREVVYDNLSRSFPEKSPQEIIPISKAFYRHFCDLWIETIKCLTISAKEANYRLRIINPELVTACFERNQSIILLTGHSGNWELLTALPLTVPHQCMAFYQPQSSAYFDGLMKLVRSRFGLLPVESGKGFKSIATRQAAGQLTLTIMVGDQSPTANSGWVWVPFLERETAFMTGAEKIAKKLGLVVLFPHIRKIKRGRYELEYQTICPDPAQIKPNDIVTSYTDHLEQAIRQAPYNWLWSHKRWKKTHD